MFIFSLFILIFLLCLRFVFNNLLFSFCLITLKGVILCLEYVFKNLSGFKGIKKLGLEAS